MIYLLDLNYTLVENSHVKKSPFSRQIVSEVYRGWLVEELRDQRVVLLTARPAKYEGLTLRSIKDKVDWLPESYHFNEHNLRPPLSKKRALIEHVFPAYGQPDEVQYFGIESNPQTRSMMAKFNIHSEPVIDFAARRGRET